MSEQLIDNNLISKDNDSIDYELKVQTLVNEGYSFDLGSYVSQGFDIFKLYAGGFILFSLLCFVINFLIGLIPNNALNSIASLIINPPLSAGYLIVGKKILYDEPYSFEDFFKGFNYIIPLFLTRLVSFIFIFAGFIIFLIPSIDQMAALIWLIPAIYLGISYLWMYHFVIFGQQQFWPAMEMSRKVITKNWLSFFGFAIVLGLINLLGLICLGIGLLVTIPATILAVLVAFKEVVGINKNQQFD